MIIQSYSLRVLQYTIGVILSITSLNSLYAQDINEQIEFRLDNDKFLFVDRYYTSGLFVSYKKQLDNDFVFKNTEENTIQLNLTLGNETYTPQDISSFDASRFDRPFAGWFFVKAETGKLTNNTALFLALEGGVTGEASLSGALQRGVHDLFGLERPSWIEEIPFKVLFNFRLNYFYNLQLNKKNALEFQVQPVLGTKDIFLENNIRYVFGKYNTLKQSSRLGVIDSTLTNEFYGLVGLGYKYVVHNTLLQGGITANETTFTVSPTRSIFRLEIGSVLKLKRNTFKFIYNFNTRETALSTVHGFGSLIFARSF